MAEPTQQFHATLVLPTYNASDFIEQTVVRMRRFVLENPAWSVMFVCDGCSDDTAAKLRALIQNDGPALKAEVYERNRGKGYAVRRGLSLAGTKYRLFTDVDLAYDPDDAPKLLAMLEEGADMVVVNRASPESTYLISPRDFSNIYKRHMMSRTFNWWLRQMLPITILDTQAGFKGMTGAAWDKLAPDLYSDGFFFDTELLARAEKLGLKVAETPVHFRYLDPTTVRMVRHGYGMFWETLKLRRALRKTHAAPTAHALTAAK